MTSEMIIAAYAVAGLPVARQAAGWALWYDVDVSEGYRPRSVEKWMAFGCFALALTTWPLWIIGAIWNAKSVAILPIPTDAKVKLQRDEVRRLEAINAEHERKLGIGQEIERAPREWR